MWPNDSAFSHTPPHTHLKGCKEGGGGWIVEYFLKKLLPPQKCIHYYLQLFAYL